MASLMEFYGIQPSEYRALTMSEVHVLVSHRNEVIKRQNKKK
jgi:hypothetical protein